MRCLSWPEAGPRRPLLRPQPGRHAYSQLPLGKRLDAVHRLELGPFQRNGIQIVTPTGGVLDLRTMMCEIYVTMQALVAAEENRKRAERIKAGKLRAIAEAASPAGPTPYDLELAGDGGDLDAPVTSSAAMRRRRPRPTRRRWRAVGLTGAVVAVLALDRGARAGPRVGAR